VQQMAVETGAAVSQEAGDGPGQEQGQQGEGELQLCSVQMSGLFAEVAGGVGDTLGQGASAVVPASPLTSSSHAHW
jgi:hypothetical protein